MSFVNDFPFKDVPKRLVITKISPVFTGDIVGNVQDKRILFRFTATVARDKSSLKNPVASRGSFLISNQKLDLKNDVVEFYTSFGIFRDVSVKIVEEESITKDSPNFVIFMINYLNRTLDQWFNKEKFEQDGRFYWLPDDISTYGRFAEHRIGVFARALHLAENNYAARIDYQTRIIGKQSVWDLIQEEIRQQNVSSWRELDLKNLNLLGGVYRVFRTTYVDYYFGEPIFRTFSFENLDTTRSISDTNEKGHIPSKYQEERGRKVIPLDQPVIMCRDRRSRPEYDPVSCIPSLLVPVIRIEDLKRISDRISKSVQIDAQPDPKTRYQETISIIDFLLDNEVLSYPKTVLTTNLGPISLQVSQSKSIEVSKDLDFRQIFSINKMSIIPSWKKIVFVYDAREKKIIDELITAFKHQFKLFEIPISITAYPFVTELSQSGEAFVRDYTNHIIKTGLKLNNQNDLLFVIKPTDSKANMKFPIKQELTIGRNLATQFMVTDVIERLRSGLKRNLVNPLFMQLVFKMGGFIATYKVHQRLNDTIIVGMDRHRAKGKISVSASAVALGSDGRFLSSYIPKFDSWKDDALGDIEPILSPLLNHIKTRKYDFKHVILLREGGTGNFQYIRTEDEQFRSIINSFDLDGTFITANKSSGIRIFEGNPEDDETITKPPQYTGILQYPTENCFIVTTTENIVTKSGERGTPRPMQYQIISGIKEVEFQLALMQTLAGLSRVGTLTSKSTRLPMPLQYAHKLAKFASDVGNTWTKPIERPLYL